MERLDPVGGGSRKGGDAPDLVEAVRCVQAGDHEAFEAIYQRFADPLFRYLYVRCYNVQQAEDLASELWVRVVERLPAFRIAPGAPEAVFVGWLYRIARNLAIDSYRRREASNSSLSTEIQSEGDGPEEQAVAGEDQNELRAAMERLTPEQREVLLLRFFEEHSVGVVAQLTGRSEGAVKVMQHRALGALARAFGVRRGKQ